MFSSRTCLTSTCLLAGLATATTGCGGPDSDASSKPAVTVTVTATPSPEVPSPGAATPSATSPAHYPPTTATATAYARLIEARLRFITKVTTLTGKSDSNHLLGRPNGYTSAAVIADKVGDTSDPDPGVAYGATVEMFATSSDAVRRMDYIQGLLKASPILGSEYDYARDRVLLRVSGDLPPSRARRYEHAFDAANNE